MSDQITCTLAENALDYLILAGEQAKEGSARMTKHAIATLADGVELLLKARLEVHDWRLVFTKKDSPTEEKYKSGDFKSVFFDEAIDRLTDFCSVEILAEHFAVIDDLRKLRHKVRHFAITITHETAISLITKTFSFAIDFISDHLEQQTNIDQKQMADLRSLLSEFEEFVDQRMGQIQSQVDANHPVLDCPTCLQTALFCEGETAYCAFCGYRADGEDAAHEWASRFCGFWSPKEPSLVENCPECGAEACVDAGAATDGEVGHVCLCCGETANYHHCPRCGQLTSDDPCADCWAEVLANND